MLVEGIDDLAAEGGDRWGGGRAQLVEEEERKKRELSESGKFKDTSSVLPGVSGPTAGVSGQGVTAKATP